MEEELAEAERRADERLGLEGGAGGAGGMQVVLHEDKKYYPAAEEVYGEGTEALFEDEDAQALEEPLVQVEKSVKFQLRFREPPASRASPDFLAGLMGNPELVRHVAVAGHLHHGKTTLVDLLVEEAHTDAGGGARGGGGGREAGRRSGLGTVRGFTDNRLDEQAREMSLKASPVSLVLQGSSGKSFLVNAMDTPGHPNFSDEVACSLRLADGLLLCVDALEGLMLGTERAIRAAVAAGLSICLVLTKVDRLILELKLPPADAYHKLRHTVEEVNACIRACPGDSEQPLLDPAAGNVAFSAALSGWSFTLPSFARMYAERGAGSSGGGASFDPHRFARRLWGDWHFDPETRGFRRRPVGGVGGGAGRTFVTFVLEPLYKIYGAVLGEAPAELPAVLREFGARLRPAQVGLDVKPLLRAACRAVFGAPAGLVDLLVQHVPSAQVGGRAKVDLFYSGPRDSALAERMRACSPSGGLLVAVTKLYPRGDGAAFDALGRVMCGTVRPGDRVRVLGEAYSPDDEEDSASRTVGSVSVFQTRYQTPVTLAKAGNWVLLEGVDSTITKTATIVGEEHDADACIFAPLTFDTASVVKVAAEPLNPQDLPKMVEGLRRINKSYPLAVTKVEESGEHTILGTGELYMDSILKDLREVYGDVEVKVADPVVCFSETVAETSALKCFAETPNGKNKLTMIAEPLEKGLGAAIEASELSLDMPVPQMSSVLRETFEWDLLAARSVWAFGPSAQGPNVLLNDTLPGEVDKSLLNAVRDSVVQGFQWGAREGPLCDEPMRDVKMRLLDAVVAEEPMYRGGGQVIPAARRVAYSAFLTATPRLMEPVYYVEVQTPADCMSSVYTVVQKRRGHVTADVPKPGTPIYVVKAFLPVIESFGFETDLRYHTQGQAFCLSVFDHWSVVPGDPLDKTVQLRPLEPSPAQDLAREFMVKTRRRKGMSEDVSVGKFFDDPMLLELARQEAAQNGGT